MLKMHVKDEHMGTKCFNMANLIPPLNLVHCLKTIPGYLIELFLRCFPPLPSNVLLDVVATQCKRQTYFQSPKR